MATTATPWSGVSADKLYLQSGQFDSTLKTSESVALVDTNPSGISWDATNTPWCGSVDNKLYLTSGQFSSTLKTSENITAVDGTPTGISWDGTNTPWSGSNDQKLYLQSGQFSSTLKTSQDAAINGVPSGISWDGTNTPWSGSDIDKLYLTSGQFSSTLKTSRSVTSVDTNSIGLSWDGTNTPWIGAGDDKLYLQSGQFDSTLKTSRSVGAVDIGPSDIDTDDVNSRLGIGGETLYAKTAGGNWSAAGTWSNVNAGGIDSSGPPTAADNVIFELLSGNVTIDAAAACRSLDCKSGTGEYAGTLTHNSGITLTIGDGTAGAGDIALRFVSGMTYTKGSATTSAIDFVSTSATQQSINVGGQVFGNLTFNAASNGSWSSGDNFSVGAATITLTKGSLTLNGPTITCGAISSSNTNVRSLTLGTNTVVCSLAGTAWDFSTATNLTLNNFNLSTIKLTGDGATFAGGGKTYGNFWYSAGAGTGSLTISGSNTFADFKDNGSAAHSILFTAGTTQTVTTFTVSGTSGNVITINSTTTGTHALVKSGGGTISRDYLNIQHSVATPSSTWYAGANSTDNQADATAGSGWIFTVPPSGKPWNYYAQAG